MCNISVHTPQVERQVLHQDSSELGSRFMTSFQAKKTVQAQHKSSKIAPTSRVSHRRRYFDVAAPERIPVQDARVARVVSKS
jgi:hypothetical protein